MGKFRRLRFAVADAFAQLGASGKDPVPPPKLSALFGGGDFKALGAEFLGHFKEVGRLKPDERVLDVGCGCGRMAAPLMGYLSEKGSYEGFDIMAVGIDWCRRRIARRDPRFHFHHAEIFNQYYNPGGTVASSEYRFPYPGADFDFVFLTSVFTHLLAGDMRHYVSEISRVLRPGGRCLSTWFVLDAESRRLMADGKSAFAVNVLRPDCQILREDKPEETVAYDEPVVRRAFASAGMAIEDPIRFGSWSGRTPHLSFQDIILAAKR